MGTRSADTESIRQSAQRSAVVIRTGAAIIALAMLGVVWLAGSARTVAKPVKKRVTIAGNPAMLLDRYERWKATATDELPQIAMALAPSEHLGARPTDLRGWATLDLRRATVRISTSGGQQEPLDVWAVGDAQSDSVSRTRTAIRLGTLSDGLGSTKDGTFGVNGGVGFRIDHLVLTEPGRGPTEAALLFGVPSLYQRLFVAEAFADEDNPTELGLGLSLPGQGGTVEAMVEETVLEGEQIFTQQEFNGNGRTCATCHRPDNNYTIDATYIAGLPNSDPLFVAETNRDLNSDFNGGRRFEVPELLRSKGLVLANADGFDDLQNKYVLRAVPHLLGVGLALEPETNPILDPTAGSPWDHRLGWGGDGSPIGVGVANEAQTLVHLTTGTLRDFAVGAVIQHFPRTLGRQAGDCDDPQADFCLPSYEQLIALEAFMLSLGRRDDGFGGLSLTDADAQAGLLFFAQSYLTSCGQTCHVGGGGNTSNDTNTNVQIGTEDLLHCTHQNEVDELQTYDAGFGTEQNGEPCEPTTACYPFDTNDSDLACLRGGSFGNLTFNTASVFEAADTPPYFHNNVVETLEEAVAFYNTPEFLKHNNPVVQSPSGVDCSVTPAHSGCLMTTTTIENTARFLRVLNSIDNIDTQTVPPLERAGVVLADPEAYEEDLAPKLLDLALANIDDIIEVLGQDQLHQYPGGAVERLNSAIVHITGLQQSLASGFAIPGDPLADALADVCLARQDMSSGPCPWL